MRILRSLMLGSLLLAAPALAAAPVPPVAKATTPSGAAAIPEPAALALFVLGAGVVGVAIRRRKD